MNNQNNAKFIVIEGLEGAGKSSAIALVKDFIEKHTGAVPVCTREPGGTPLAEKCETWLKWLMRLIPCVIKRNAY